MNTKNQDFLRTIQQIHRKIVDAEDFPQDLKDIAIKTDGIPVYQDMGGVLLLALDGSILHHDPEVDRFEIVEEERWRTVALVRAAKKFPELEKFLPTRPGNAVECDACDGKGIVFESYSCGVCYGQGWILERVGEAAGLKPGA